MKPWYKQKTTLTALMGALILLGLLIALIAGKITSDAFTASLGGVGAFLGVLIGLFSKDQEKGKEDAV